MTTSPCKNCPNRFKSKFVCAKDCEALKQFQERYSNRRERSLFSAIDYAEEGRFTINHTSRQYLP